MFTRRNRRKEILTSSVGRDVPGAPLRSPRFSSTLRVISTTVVPILFLFFSLTLQAQTFQQPGYRGVLAGPRVVTRTFLSPNGKYRLTLDDAGIAPRSKVILSASISKMDGNVSVLRWATNFEGPTVMVITDRDALVSDDGRFFLFAENQGRDWYLCREGKKPQSLVTSRDLYQSRGPATSLERLIEIDQLNGEPIVRLWNGIWNRWSAYYVHRDDSITVTDELEARWNEATRQKILDALARARLELVRKKVGAFSKKLGEIAGNALSSVKPTDIREVHYEFLALRRQPEDRVWFERLLSETDPNPIQMTPRGGYSLIRKINGVIQTFPATQDYYHYDTASYARTRGDWLLALFDKKDVRGLADHNRPLFYLGTISGKVKLPTPIQKRAGRMRIYLTPENRVGKDWSPDSGEAIDVTLDNQLPTFDFADEVSFKFGSVSTGKFALKAIWDRRPGFLDKQKPGPGDYESAWSAPLTVSPGAVTANIMLVCTNRAAGGEAYYAADESAAKKWNDGELSLLSFQPDPDGRREVVSSPFKRWLIHTNYESPRSFHGIIRIALMVRPPPQNPNNLARPPELVLLARRGSILQASSVKVRILDEHGCAYLPTVTRSFANATAATFPSFPGNSKTFRLVAFGNKKEILFDYTLTNLFQKPTPVLGSPRQFPIELALGNVTMKINGLTGYSQSPQAETTFTENGQWTNGWWASEILFADAHGNFLDPEDMCREQTIHRVIGRISRNTPGSRETRPFEFTMNRWKPWTEKD